MRIGKNSKKWLERIVLSCLIVVGIIFGGWLFFATNFMHPFIHYLDLRGGIIYYKEPTNIIASNVLGFDEVRGKIYYIVNVNIRMYNFDDVQCTVIPSVAYGFVTGMNLQLC